MSKRFIVIGDRTSHGGTVIGGSAFSLTGDRKMARNGDHVYCPKCKRTTVIISNNPTLIIDGAAVALDGDKTSCGATLISSQHATSYEDSCGSSNNTSSLSSSASYLFAEGGDSDYSETIEQFFTITGKDGLPVNGYKFDLFSEGKLHTQAGQFTEGKTSVVSAAGDIRLVMWPEIDGGAFHG